ncbi:MAG TPA: 23S rRNA (guanosine(2251)-2'-O)-methyltransferase RlmB [Candidatus Limnocylindrales bacterium]|nr:23S rRNA (guanosine(2251)-2'-O)-methyltransferase RlmB [Candidatus Limnocylindrales bacterium]
MRKRVHPIPLVYPATGREELIIGRQSVLEALRCRKPYRILLTEGQKGAILASLSELARLKAVPVNVLSRADFEHAVGALTGHQGVAAVVPPFQYLSLEALIRISQSTVQQPFLLMLDHIEDPQNFGAVMRTANAAGIHGIIIPSHRTATVTAAVCKVAAGAAEHLPVAVAGSLVQAAAVLKKNGFWLYGAEADGDSAHYRADYRVPLVLIIGSEGRGLSRPLRESCDQIVSIPMPGAAGSLNVAAAAAVLIYTALSQRAGWSS